MAITNILSHLIELAANVSDAFTTALFQADRDRKSLFLREHQSLSGNCNGEVVIPFNDGPIGKVAQTLKPEIIEYFEEGINRLSFYRKDEELKSLLALPVVYEELEGILVVDSKESYSFTPKIQKILRGFSDQMAWHLHQEKLTGEVSQKSDPLFGELNSCCRFIAQSPNRPALAERLAQIPPSLIPADATAVIWFDGVDIPGRIQNHRGFIQPISSAPILPGKGIAGSCAKNLKPILIPNAEGRKTILFHEEEEMESLKSVTAVPIMISNQLQGVLLCASEKPGTLNHTHVDRLTLITSSAAAALVCADTKRRWDYDKNLDQITGVPNHRFLMEHHVAVAHEIFKGEKPVFLCTFAVNNLPSIYETFGLACGDQLLRQIVSMFSKVIPSPKYVFKYSDTSLLIIMMERELKESREITGRLKKVFEKNTFFVNGKSLQLETSWGNASYPNESGNLLDLIGIAWSRTTQSMKEVPC